MATLTPNAQLAAASRFLAQATVGTTYSAIEQLSKGSVEGWLNAQFATSRETTYVDWLLANGYGAENQIYEFHAWQNPVWRGLFMGNDALRQRTTLALLDLFVVGITGQNTNWRGLCLANYIDTLADHSFGNFRELLEAITYSPAMGVWLTYIGSRKADGRGTLPDENYAREIMQLFTIGLYELNDDGTFRTTAAGYGIPTYNQQDVSELAKVFTGFTYNSSDKRNRQRYLDRLVIDPGQNHTGTANFLGHTVSGGGANAVSRALDILFNHANVGPFIARRLIQSLVTSNPSRGYVRRVATAFANNGAGVRGDMKAVWRAILLDDEARNSPAAYAGKLRDPIQRFLNWGRAFQVRDSSNQWSITPSLTGALVKSPGWSPTVFNFYEPDYSPPQTAINQQGLFAPEFQLASEQTAISYINFMERAIDGYYAYRGLTPDFSDYMNDAKDATQLVNKLNIVLAAGQLSPGTLQAIRDAVNAQPASSDNQLKARIKLATLAVMASPDYLILE